METPAEPLFYDPTAQEYATWLSQLRPRTCLLMHWLANLEAVQEPGEQVRQKARRFAEKRRFLGQLVDEFNAEASDKTHWLMQSGDFDNYMAWLMWLRFREYVPARFVAPAGQEKVLRWIRGQLRRPELTDLETIGELQWQIERLHALWDGPRDALQDETEM